MKVWRLTCSQCSRRSFSDASSPTLLKWDPIPAKRRDYLCELAAGEVRGTSFKLVSSRNLHMGKYYFEAHFAFVAAQTPYWQKRPYCSPCTARAEIILEGEDDSLRKIGREGRNIANDRRSRYCTAIWAGFRGKVGLITRLLLVPQNSGSSLPNAKRLCFDDL